MATLQSKPWGVIILLVMLFSVVGVFIAGIGGMVVLLVVWKVFTEAQAESLFMGYLLVTPVVIMTITSLLTSGIIRRWYPESHVQLWKIMLASMGIEGLILVWSVYLQ